jgi:hypothetical protein
MPDPNDIEYLTGTDARRALGLVDDALADYDALGGGGVISQGQLGDDAVIAPSRPQGAFTPEQVDALRAQVLGGVGAPSVSGSGNSRLMNAAPGWYTPSEPPKTRTTLGALAGGAGALAQGAQATAESRAQDPYRSPQNKAKDQVNATKAGIASSLLGYFAGQPQAEFQNRQDTALKDAQMQKLASDRFNAGGNTALGLLNYDDRVRQHNAGLAAAEAKAQLAREMADPSSERSVKMRAAARAAKLEGVTDDMSADDITKMRTALMQAHHEDHTASEFDRRSDRAQAETLSKEERGNAARIEQEKREASEREAQSAIPGLVPVSGRAPHPADVSAAKDLKTDLEELRDAAGRLQAIQKEVEDANRIAGVLGGYDGTKWAVPEKQQQLIAEANYQHLRMISAARKVDKLGVLQQFEKQMEEGVNPRVGTFNGYFTGKAQWGAIDKYYSQYAQKRMHDLGYAYEGTPEAANAKSPALDRPTAEQVRTYPKPAIRDAKGNVQPNYGEVSQGASGAATGPAAPRPAAPMSGAGIKGTAKDAIGVFQIADGSSPYYLTQAQYQKMVEKYGADRVKRLQ